jgi:hypothetical protein
MERTYEDIRDRKELQKKILVVCLFAGVAFLSGAITYLVNVI